VLRAWIGAGCLLVLGAAEPALAQTSTPSSGDLFAPLTNLFNQAATSLSGVARTLGFCLTAYPSPPPNFRRGGFLTVWPLRTCAQ
jgi:hypothetical protein